MLVRLLKEPLLHFLVLGAALFWLYGAVADEDAEASESVVRVSEGRVEQLAQIYAKTWSRPPTRGELEGLVQDFVLEEIYYREAKLMGIDRDDTMIRRRLRQKLEFLTDDLATALEPTEEVLQTYLAENPEPFRRDPEFTFEQVYLNPERHGDGLEKKVAEVKKLLQEGKEVRGDSGMIPPALQQAPTQVVDNTFGLGFAERLLALEPGIWQGPVRSGLGLHLVRVGEVMEGRLPELEEIRGQVAREWSNEQREKYRDAINEGYLDKYEVIVEWPKEEAS